MKPSARDYREHYELERRLSDKLRKSTKAERKNLYNEVYDEIYSKVPYLLPLTIKTSKEKLSSDLKMLKPYLNKETVFLEVGPGNCIFAFAVSAYVKQVYAVDVSNEVTKKSNPPKNFELIISDGTDIPLPPASVDFVYSNQLMEHLHPEDAKDQLVNIYQALKAQGSYFCRTPNRLSGPHDISKFFDDEATGFHLKEYTIGELRDLFKEIGFRKFTLVVGAKGLFLSLPCWPIVILEKCLLALPLRLRKPLGRFFPLRLLLGIKLLATK